MDETELVRALLDGMSDDERDDAVDRLNAAPLPRTYSSRRRRPRLSGGWRGAREAAPDAEGAPPAREA
jgi:hypothetical protein